MTLTSIPIINNKGKPSKYIFIHHCGSVVIVPFITKTKVLLVSQYRYPIKQTTLEFPAGHIEKGEKAQEAAYRELKEEIGFTAGKMTYIGSFYPSNGISDEKVAIFVATKLQLNISKKSDKKEKFNVVEIELHKVLDKIYDHTITDGFTIISSLFTQNYLNYE